MKFRVLSLFILAGVVIVPGLVFARLYQWVDTGTYSGPQISDHWLRKISGWSEGVE